MGRGLELTTSSHRRESGQANHTEGEGTAGLMCCGGWSVASFGNAGRHPLADFLKQARLAGGADMTTVVRDHFPDGKDFATLAALGLPVGKPFGEGSGSGKECGRRGPKEVIDGQCEQEHPGNYNRTPLKLGVCTQFRLSTTTLLPYGRWNTSVASDQIFPLAAASGRGFWQGSVSFHQR